jgi:enamine deaminase RidA (YjgF/YER057c/UK114 family)
MTVTRLHAGPRMSQVVIHGSTIYLAGQVADQAKGKSVGDQTKEILATIDRLLGEAGSDKTQILSTTIYLADIGAFAEMNAVWDAWVPAGHAPARATVEAKLAARPYTVEIACIAAKS